MPKTRVLFITGWLRSGTTVLGNALGSSQNIEHIGELHYLWDPHHPAGGECGCTLPLTECPVWGNVLNDLVSHSVDRFSVNRVRLEHWRMRDLPHRYIDFRSQNLPMQYPDLLGDVYSGVSRYAKAALIVDSTKLPGDAFAAASAKDTDTYILHVVRDPRASSYSSLRTKRHTRSEDGPLMRKHRPAANSGNWLAFNALSDTLLKNIVGPGRYRTLRYEDFVLQPHESLRSLCEWLQIDKDSLPLAGDTGIKLSTNHTVMGNPNRFRTGSMELAPDDEWKTSFRGLPRFLSTLTSAPLLRHYDYPWIIGAR